MVQFISLIAGAAATQYATTLIASEFLAALAGAMVAGVVASVLIDKPSVSNFNVTAANILLNKKSNNSPIPVIYGIRRVGGIIVFMATKDKSILNLNLAICEGEIEGYLVYYFNGKSVSADTDLLIDEYFGTETQEANAILKNNYTYYNANHKLQGTAYLAFQIQYDREKYPAGVPVINALVKGIKMFDPRTSLVEWSDNPVLCLRDYLTNSRYGRDINASLIDDTSFILAANYCDEEVAYDGINLITRYTCNGVVETQNNSLDIIKQLLSSFRGILIFSSGLYKVIIDKPELAVFTFSEDNIIGGWIIKLGDKNSQYNRMRANFFNTSKEYQPDIAIVDSTELREQDGGLLETMTSLPFNTDIIRARAITSINLKQSRHAISCEFTATIEALRVEVGDVVYINHKTPGWDTHNSGQGKKFRIMRVTIQNNDEVRILATEYADEVYDIGIIDDVAPGVVVDIDDLSFCRPPTNLTVTTFSHTNAIITWIRSRDAFVVGYEVSSKKVRDDDWSQISVGNNFQYTYTYRYRDLKPAKGGWEFRVRAINTIGVKSAWLT